MENTINNGQSQSRFYLFMAVCFAFVFFFVAFGWFYGTPDNYVPNGFAASSRSLNSMLGAVLTSITLVISLTSNLYTPRLVQLFLTHPVILVGLITMVSGHMFSATAMFFVNESPFHTLFLSTSTILTYCAYAGILPFLYMVSQFLRPSYFMPLLLQKALSSVRSIENTKQIPTASRQIYAHINVITNICFTGMRRGDRQLSLLTLSCLHDILLEIIRLDKVKSRPWRLDTPFYSASLAKEGREYLKTAEIWPEAYLLGQIVQIMDHADARQNELISATAERLINSFKLAIKQHNEGTVELHILVFNSLMRLALDDKDLRKFQNLSYHYRVLIEATWEHQRWMNEAVRHLLHYGKMAKKSNLAFGIDTVLFDMGDIILSLAQQDEYTALTFLHIYAGPAWLEVAHENGPEANSVWRSMIRVYWEARAREHVLLAETLSAEFLDKTQHMRLLKKIIEDNRPLHWEYNDRLMRFAYLSPSAERLAASFSNENF